MLGTFRTTDLVVDDTETLNGTLLLARAGSPNGVVTAPKGSLALDKATPALYQNQDGATTWAIVGGTSGSASITLTHSVWATDLGSATLIAAQDWVSQQTITTNPPRTQGAATGAGISAKRNGGDQLLVPGLQWIATNSPQNFISTCNRTVTIAASDTMFSSNLVSRQCIGIFRVGTDFGLQIVAPSDARTHTLKFYGGHFGSTVQCTASLADGEGTPSVLSSSTGISGDIDDIWTVQYSSTYTTNLLLSCIITVDESAGASGNIRWQAYTMTIP
jgi:hypothetical protein